MANSYSAGGSRRAAVFVAIIGLHFGFYYLLVSGLARAGLEIIQDIGIIDLPPPPPPPEDLDEPPPPPPIDRPPPVVPPPLIDLPDFSGPTNAISNVQITDKPQPAPRAVSPPPRAVQITPPSLRGRSDRIGAAINSCYPSASRRLSEEGRVVVTVTIEADGKSGDVAIAQSSGFERLDGAAECVVRKLSFNPGKRDGQPIDAQATLPITFKLE